jgi:hypothetical protein
MVDEVEQAVVGPVQVLEDEDERALLGQALEEATPGSEGLGPALTSRGRLLAEPDERLEMGYEPFELRGVGDVPHRAAQLLLGDVARIGLEDSGLGFDDLGESPERHALAVRERASLPPEDEIGIGLDGVQELVDEAALADAGHPDEREELGRAILARPRERSPEEVELLRSADESRAGLPRDVDAEAGPCLDRFPDRQRLGLALDQHGLSLAVDDRPLGSAVVVSPTRIPSTGAAAWRRAAVLTTSPEAMPSPSLGRAANATSASPVVTAMRTWSSSLGSPSFSSPIASLIARAARGRPRARPERRTEPRPRRR